jgi:hypothetical protein
MEIATKVLTPEFKKNRLFFKIENTEETMNVSQIRIILNTIDSISAVYTVDTNQIKKKFNFFNTNDFKQKTKIVATLGPACSIQERL